MPQIGKYIIASFQIRVEKHLTHITTKKGSVAFLALTAPRKIGQSPKGS